MNNGLPYPLNAGVMGRLEAFGSHLLSLTRPWNVVALGRDEIYGE